MLMETLMFRVRELHPTPTRSPPAGPSVGPGDDVSMAASALADVILLCANNYLRGADMMDMIYEQRGIEGCLQSRIERIRDNSGSSVELRRALLEACTTLLPRITAREFDVVLCDALPRLLRFVQGASQTQEHDASSRPIVVDFLTRVLLTQMSNSGKSKDIETLSRQLATAATRDGDASATDKEHHADVEFLAASYHNLRCISVALSQITAKSSKKAEDILLNAALELAGKLCDNVGMVSKVAQLFESCPDEKSKQHVSALCNAKHTENV